MVRIGWATGEITPPRPVMVQGQMHRRISESVLDPLTATAMAIEGTSPAGDDCAVIVSLDLCMVSPMMRERIREIASHTMPDFPQEKLILAATHTHTAPVTGEGWYNHPGGDEVMTIADSVEFMSQAIVEIIKTAWNNRTEMKLSRAFGYAVVGHTRRITYHDGHALMYGKTNQPEFKGAEGYVDHTMDMLFTFDANDAVTGMVLCVPCPSQVTEGLSNLSADYWHEARTEIRKRLGTDVPILPLCGPAGDISPRPLFSYPPDAYMRSLCSRSEREAIGWRIANTVDEALPLARANKMQDETFRHITGTLELTPRRVTDEEYQTCKERYKQTGDNETLWRKEQMDRVEDLYKHRDTVKPYAMEQHVLRIGDMAYATNSFELYVEYGLRIKSRSRAPQTMLSQLTAEWGGYLPTPEGIRGGHYSAQALDNIVGPEGGGEMVEATLQAIDELFPQES